MCTDVWLFEGEKCVSKLSNTFELKDFLAKRGGKMVSAYMENDPSLESEEQCLCGVDVEESFATAGLKAMVRSSVNPCGYVCNLLAKDKKSKGM